MKKLEVISFESGSSTDLSMGRSIGTRCKKTKPEKIKLCRPCQEFRGAFHFLWALGSKIDSDLIINQFLP
jgi:hypothetical protein